MKVLHGVLASLCLFVLIGFGGCTNAEDAGEPDMGTEGREDDGTDVRQDSRVPSNSDVDDSAN